MFTTRYHKTCGPRTPVQGTSTEQYNVHPTERHYTGWTEWSDDFESPRWRYGSTKMSGSSVIFPPLSKTLYLYMVFPDATVGTPLFTLPFWGTDNELDVPNGVPL